MENKVGTKISLLLSDKKIIGKRIVRTFEENNKDITIFNKYDFLKSYEKCYHGTKFDNLISILKYGFLKPGCKTPEGK